MQYNVEYATNLIKPSHKRGNFMDLRVEKTIKSIFNAFLELRAKNPLEKISVTELSERATINKATFYLHFKDIYDLSDTLESELVNSIIDKISPEEFEREPIAAIDALTEAYASKKNMISILFDTLECIRRLFQIPIAFDQSPSCTYTSIRLWAVLTATCSSVASS